jgi:hypothetical protein
MANGGMKVRFWRFLHRRSNFVGGFLQVAGYLSWPEVGKGTAACALLSV